MRTYQQRTPVTGTIEAGGPMTPTLQESAARCGEHCWVERRLFELLGSWVADVRAPAAEVVLDRLSQHAAWRAAQWWDRLPVLAQIDRDDLVRPGLRWAFLAGAPDWWDAPPAPGEAPAAGDAAVGSAGPMAVVARLILPRLAVDYHRHAGEASPVADGAVARTLAQAGADVAADWLAATAVLDAIAVSPAELAASGQALVRAEAAAAPSVGAPGGTGPR